MKNNRKNSGGGGVLSKNAFTLIELLVVVLIIGILAAVALPQYTKTVLRSRMAEAMTNIKGLGEAERRYFMENEKYTLNFEELDISMSDSCTGSFCAVGKFAYFLDLDDTKNVTAYYNSSGQNTTELAISYRVAPDATFDMKEGEFACLPRGKANYIALCKALAGSNYRTDSSFFGGTGYVWRP